MDNKEAKRLPFPVTDNEIIVKFLGYNYKYAAIEDFSDEGGIYSDVVYYSKEPLLFKYAHEDQNDCGESPIYDDYKKFHEDVITVEIDNWRYHEDYLHYHDNWNSLMKAALELKMDAISTNIEIAY